MPAREAADALGVTDSWVRILAGRGVLRSMRLGGVVLVVEDDVRSYGRDRGWCNRYGVRGGKLAAEREDLL